MFVNDVVFWYKFRNERKLDNFEHPCGEGDESFGIRTLTNCHVSHWLIYRTLQVG